MTWNLNLLGDYKPVILEYITNKHPELVPLYEAIYKNKDRSYWNGLNLEMQAFCKQHELVYIRNDDSLIYSFEAPPVVVNYFFHEELKKSSKKIRKWAFTSLMLVLFMYIKKSWPMTKTGANHKFMKT